MNKGWANVTPGNPGNKRRVSPMRIGDVARRLDVSVVTLRWWQIKFRLRSGRTKGGQRYYSTKQFSVLRKIRRLLHVELYTIAGAKRQLRLAAERAKVAG